MLRFQLAAQVSKGDSLKGLHLLYPTYQLSLPAADMADRFGLSHAIGAGYSYSTLKNWMFGVEGNFIFRDGVKNPGSYLSGITTSDGFVIDQSGTFANVMLLERGFTLWAKAGKVFPFSVKNQRTGIIVQLGAGMLQHKIRIEVQGNSAPQLSAAYKRGYDHLCNGPALSQFVGYQYLAKGNKIHFFAGFEFVQAFTQSWRTYYFNEMQYANEKRFDMLNSVKIGWYIPLYGKTRSQYFYY